MKRTALASLIALGVAASAAQAQVSLGSGGNIVGGGVATLTGGGDNLSVVYSGGGAGGGSGNFEQAGRIVTFAGTDGDGPRWSYGTPTNLNGGREARLVGGGDNAEVVYIRPR